VLSTLWTNLTTCEAEGDTWAAQIRQRMRIVVAGGDGTVTWVLGAIHNLQLDPVPPVAVLPLGTGNDLSLNFGWGTTFSWRWMRLDNVSID
jgi:diacylglycerol kinase (ATP)